MIRRFATRLSRLGLGLSAIAALAAPGCSQTPVLVPMRTMERPRDVDLLCLKHTPDDHWHGVPLAKCAADENGNAVSTDAEYRLHALVTQVTRGEVTVVDMATTPLDTTAAILKVDPRIPGFSSLPVGPVPSDIATDPNGRAAYVSSGGVPRVDIIPAEMIRGPLDTTAESGGPLPWPKIDLDATFDGLPAALAITDVTAPTGTATQLYVSLPDASGGSKLAVFDLTNALAPTRLADIHLGAFPNTHVALSSVDCSTPASPNNPNPWWATYEACFGGATLPVPTPPTQTPFTRMHLAGIAVVGDTLFAADDTAPFVHVFDLASGVEEQRIGVGRPTGRLAVSEPVPDEVDQQNAAAIEVCERLGWFGDGLDHTTDFAIQSQPAGKPGEPTPPPVRYGDVIHGRCAAHRYIYATDPVDVDAGDGGFVAIDVPVYLARKADDPTHQYLLTNGVPPPVTGEAIDPAGAEMAQPLACDSPSFPARRVSLTVNGVGFGVNATTPIRSLAFIKRDVPSPTKNLKGLRAVPWPIGKFGPEFQDIVASGVKPLFAKIDTAGIRSDENAWASNAAATAPRLLRGLFALAGLSNGSVIAIDVDDYDRLARAPLAQVGGANATDEMNDRVVLRHHPRLTRLYTPDALLVLNSTLTLDGGSLSNDLGSDAGRSHPHLVPFSSGNQVETSATSPFPLQSETWTVTYEGALPGYLGTAGSINGGETDAQLVDPAGHFCRRGVEATLSADTNDIVQIVDAVCPSYACLDDKGQPSDAIKQACLDAYGSELDVPLKATRDLLIGEAYEDHVTITKHVELDANGNPHWLAGLSMPIKSPVPGVTIDLKTCFPGLTRYVVRANSQWVVVGTNTGFLHRRIPSVADDPSALCVTDTTRPHLYQGRAWELPALDKNATQEPADIPLGGDDCNVLGTNVMLFENPSIKFAIRSGQQTSLRDMQFGFALRVLTSSLIAASVTLPTSVKPFARIVNGEDQLYWQRFAVVDGIDHGLSVYSYDLLTSSNYP